MAGLKELRVRISSIASTKKITSAMKMVAAARLRRANESLDKSENYHQSILTIAGRIFKNLQDDEKENSEESDDPLESNEQEQSEESDEQEETEESDNQEPEKDNSKSNKKSEEESEEENDEDEESEEEINSEEEDESDEEDGSSKNKNKKSSDEGEEESNDEDDEYEEEETDDSPVEDPFADEEDIRLYKNLKFPSIEYINENQEIDLGELAVQIISLRGHTLGSLGYLVKEEKILIAGDAISNNLWFFLKESLAIEDMLPIYKKANQLDFEKVVSSHSKVMWDKELINVIIANLEQIAAGTFTYDSSTNETIMGYETTKAFYSSQDYESTILIRKN